MNDDTRLDCLDMEDGKPEPVETVNNPLIHEYETPGKCNIHGDVIGISFRDDIKSPIKFICEKCFDEVLEKKVRENLRKDR